MHVMAREVWTDERLDDLTRHVDEGFREIRADIRQLREESKTESALFQSEISSLRKEFGEARGQVAKIDARIDELVRSVQIGFWLIGSFLVGLMGMFATQL